MKKLLYILLLLILSNIQASYAGDEYDDYLYDTVYLKEVVVPEEIDSILRNVVIPQLQESRMDSTHHPLVINVYDDELTIEIFDSATVVDFGLFFKGYNDSYPYMVYFYEDADVQVSTKAMPLRVHSPANVYTYDPSHWRYHKHDNEYRLTFCDPSIKYPWLDNYTPEERSIIFKFLYSEDSNVVREAIREFLNP